MPRNEVIERMAKKLQADAFQTARSVHRWERTSERVKNYWRDDALELLGIVEEGVGESHRWMGKYVEIYVSAEIYNAFQLAREAREGREKI